MVAAVGQRSPLGAALRSPLGARTRGGARLYLGLANGDVLCVDPETGSLVWSVNLAASGWFNIARHALQGSIVVSRFDSPNRQAFGLSPADGSVRWSVDSTGRIDRSISERPDGRLLLYNREYRIDFDEEDATYTPVLLRTLTNIPDTSGTSTSTCVGEETICGFGNSNITARRLAADGSILRAVNYATANPYSSTEGAAHADDRGLFFGYISDSGPGPYTSDPPQSGRRLYEMSIKLITPEIPDMGGGGLEDNFPFAVVNEVAYGDRISFFRGFLTRNRLAGCNAVYPTTITQNNRVSQLRADATGFQVVQPDPPDYPATSYFNDSISAVRIPCFLRDDAGSVFACRPRNGTDFDLVKTAAPYDSHEWALPLAAQATVMLM
ncbi:MAG: PQQ-binding-like beta-propeller repeat protein [Planctomycetota bacterium]